MAHYKLMVMTNAVEGRDDDFNDWYSGRHLDDVLKVPGIVRGQRFKTLFPQREDAPPKWQYLALFDCETDDVEALRSELGRRLGTEDMPGTDAIAAGTYMIYFEPVTELRTSA